METRAERAERMRAHAVDQYKRFYGTESNSAHILSTASNVRQVQVSVREIQKIFVSYNIPNNHGLKLTVIFS